jgi:hypothetical protein
VDGEDLLRAERFEACLNRVGLDLSPPREIVKLDGRDVQVEHVLQGIQSGEHSGLSALNLIVEKYFPKTERAQIRTVGGGWSGDSLLQIFIDGDEAHYYLKFFGERSRFTDEMSAHRDAQRWLGERTVDLVAIPDLIGLPEQGILDAFPVPYLRHNSQRVVYPLCFRSASSTKLRRKTLKELYATSTEDFLAEAIDSVLEVLQSGQDPHLIATGPALEARKNNLFRDARRTSIVLETIDDLRRYAMCIDGGVNWNAREHAITGLLLSPFPTWLVESCSGFYGHVHGDPNSRNILLCPDSPSDLRLIDCGGYKACGLLVHDLAQMETDIKLTLLGTEGSNDFMDLDAQKLPYWTAMETGVLRAGLSVDERLITVLSKDRPSILRAYSLIRRVREVAARMSRDVDSEGRHYFASLLYWNLRWLRLPSVRRTKKLLALYSASEILDTFKGFA